MTERLYYTDSFLHEFEARVVSVTNDKDAPRSLSTARLFIPASGGQVFDTGWIEISGSDGDEDASARQ